MSRATAKPKQQGINNLFKLVDSYGHVYEPKKKDITLTCAFDLQQKAELIFENVDFQFAKALNKSTGVNYLSS